MDGNASAVMAAGDDNGQASRILLHANIQQRVAFTVGQCKLLGIIGKQADTIVALIDHTVDDPALTIYIKIAGFRKWCGNDGKYARVGIA